MSAEQIEAAIDAAFLAAVARYGLTVMPTRQAAQERREKMATRNHVMSLLRKGLSDRAVSEECDIHVSQVYLYAREAGEPVGNGKRGRPRKVTA